MKDQMIQKVFLSFLGFSFFLVSPYARAGRDCRVLQVTCTMMRNGDNTAEVLHDRLEEVYQEEKTAGRDFEVAIVGRMGTNLDDVKVFKNEDSYGRLVTLDAIVEQATSSTSSGNRYFCSRSS